MVYSESELRSQIEKLYKQAPEIHVTVTQSRPKVVLKNAEATIVGVYLHIFCVEERSQKTAQRHFIRYADIGSKQVEILELNLTKTSA